jgi:hypothetical protein
VLCYPTVRLGPGRHRREPRRRSTSCRARPFIADELRGAAGRHGQPGFGAPAVVDRPRRSCARLLACSGARRAAKLNAVSPLWVASLNISRRTADKITQLHDIAEQEVREAVTCVEGLSYVWHEHPDRGWRAIVRTEIRGRPVLIVLFDANHPLGDVYNLASAYFIDG